MSTADHNPHSNNAAETLRKIAALHAPVEHYRQPRPAICKTCRTTYPCATVEAIDWDSSHVGDATAPADAAADDAVEAERMILERYLSDDCVVCGGEVFEFFQEDH